MRLLLHTAIGFMIVLASTTSYADDKVEAARLFDLGKRHYNLNEFDEAIAQFKSAYKLAPDPVYLFNIAQSFRLKGNDWCGLAAQFYATYQREETDKKLRDSVKKRHDEMEACAKKYPQKAEPPPPPPTTGTGATEPPPTTGTTAAVLVPPPATPTTSPNLTPAQPNAEPEDPKRTRRIVGKVLMVVGALNAIATVVYWGTGNGFANRAKECRSSTAEADECFIDALGLVKDDVHIANLERHRDDNYTLSFLSGIVGVACVTIGYVVYKKSKKTDAPKVTVMPTRSGAAFGWSF